MINNGLFSKLFIDDVRSSVALDDQGEGRFATLAHLWKSHDATSSDSLWGSFCKQALSGISFVPENQSEGGGFYPLYEDWGFENALTVVLVLGADADIDDTRVGRFWPVKLIKKLRQRQLTWGILTDGDVWRLYSTKTAKPYEDYVELPLTRALEQQDKTEYALFERFFHANSFVPEDDDSDEKPRSEGTSVRIYKCPLDRDAEKSEQILEEKVKKPFLSQVDEVLQYICNGFIADTAKPGEDYTEEERGEIFQSAVKLLYRCMFLFYAESRKLLPSDASKRQEYDCRFSIRSLCQEARKFYWNQRTDTEGFDLWYHLKGLVRAVNEGDPEYGIMGYNGGLFDDEQETFLGQHRLRNDFLARALYLMAHVQPPSGQGQEAEYEIPFRDLEVRHLGELYENILEFSVLLAEVPRIRRRTPKGVQTLLASETTLDTATDTRIERGQVYFAQTALERKQSGSYYTPESLVGFLVNKAVVVPLRERFDAEYRPRLHEFTEQTRTGFDEHYQQGAAREAEALVLRFINDVVLKFRVCDPAMGSGHFLVSAANRLTDLAIDLLDEVPIPESARASEAISLPNHWRRRVTRNCVYGVDLSPLAVDLARLSLWLNSFATDHKLTFLDHRLKHGNSLMGIRSLDALNRIPKRKKSNPKKGKERLDGLFSHAMLAAALERTRQLEQVAEDDTETQRQLYEDAMDELRGSLGPLADAYTTYLTVQDISPETYRAVVEGLSSGRNGALLDTGEIQVAQQMQAELTAYHHFFHWPLEFPDVFAGQETTGFDATVGNPPWNVLQPDSQEFYSAYDPEFRTYKKQQALQIISDMEAKYPEIGERWEAYQKRIAEAAGYCKQPSSYTALQKGKIDLYRAFLERFFQILRKEGRMGIVVPSGLYTDQSCQPLREMFFTESQIDSLYCFENRWPAVFPAVDNRFKFVTFSTASGGQTTSFTCAFMAHDPEKLSVIEAQGIRLRADSVRKFSAGSLGLMEFRSQKEADLVARLYDDRPTLGEFLPKRWNVQLSQEFNMTSDSHLFNEDGDGAPLHGGKTIRAFDHQFSPITYWIQHSLVQDDEWRGRWRKLRKRKQKPARFDHQHYRTGFRRIARSADERAFISTVIPASSVCPDTTLVVRRLVPAKKTGQPEEWIGSAQSTWLASVFNSYVLDFLIRMKITTHLDMHFVYALPVPRLGCGDSLDDVFFTPVLFRALRLICTTNDYADLWSEVFPQIPESARVTEYSAYGQLDGQDTRQRLADSAAALTPEWGPHCGVHDRTADRRDWGDRAQLRAEIDAYVAHLYGLGREDFAYILDTFPVLRRKEEKAFGEFMSKRKCLEEYDRLATILPDAENRGTT